MASASSLAQLQSQTTRGKDSSGSLETVEIDPQFASALGFQQGDVVEIGLLHDLSIAQSLSTEPLTADDWEILVRLNYLPEPKVENNNMSRFAGIACWLC